MWFIDVIRDALPHKKLSDMDRLYFDIADKFWEIAEFNQPRKGNHVRCKSDEDDRCMRGENLDMELKQLELTYKNTAIKILNTFPLNKPCTIPYVADYVGIKKHDVVWDALIVHVKTGRGAGLLQSYFCSNVKHNRFEVVSDWKLTVTFIERVINDRTKNYIYNYHMIQPNWRFVESKLPDIFYVERFED